MEETILQTIKDVGFPIAVTIYLLYERAKEKVDLKESIVNVTSKLDEIAIVLKERMPNHNAIMK